MRVCLKMRMFKQAKIMLRKDLYKMQKVSVLVQLCPINDRLAIEILR